MYIKKAQRKLNNLVDEINELFENSKCSKSFKASKKDKNESVVWIEHKENSITNALLFNSFEALDAFKRSFEWGVELKKTKEFK